MNETGARALRRAETGHDNWAELAPSLQAFWLARYDAVAAAISPVLTGDLTATIERVHDLTFASDDGSEYDHNDGCEGEAECAACWAADIRRVLGRAA